jgi:hypothetical protein
MASMDGTKIYGKNAKIAQSLELGIFNGYHLSAVKSIFFLINVSEKRGYWQYFVVASDLF